MENTFCRKIKNQGPVGKENDPRKARGLDGSHEGNELLVNSNGGLKEEEGKTKASKRLRKQPLTRSNDFYGQVSV
jgi:hypothetical protein